jgi:hypothetical protein
MFGRQNRIDEAEMGRAVRVRLKNIRSQTRDPRVMAKVCSCAEKLRIKSLATAGVVRDNAVIEDVETRDGLVDYPAVTSLG